MRAPAIVAAAGIVAAMFCGSAVAGTMCASNVNLSTLIGTTCDIGALQFDFTELLSKDYSENTVTNVTHYGAQWTANDFTFTTVSNGFTLSFDGGKQSIAAPGLGAGTGLAYDWVDLQYTVTATAGKITDEIVSGGSLSVTGSTKNSDDMSSVAAYEGITQGITQNTTPFVQDICGTSELLGVVTNECGHGDFGGPFVHGLADAYPFYLDAFNGAGAEWDGTPTTFTYGLSNPFPVSGPSALSVFAVAVAGLAAAGLIRNRSASGKF